MADGHIPVMLSEMIANLNVREGGIYLDATFGGGGYTHAILKQASCQVIALDRDPEALQRGQELKRQYPTHFHLYQGCFSELPMLAQQHNWPHFDGIVFDFGVSSFQIDQPDRGFSFRFDGPLDMRMSREGISAADVVNSFEAEELANIFYQYGEERKSRRIAAAIVRRRLERPFTTTRDLADMIEKLLGRRVGAQHPATLVFQALRIFVNNELQEVEEGLKFAEKFLKPQGRLVTITFHSLEDRLVKTFIRARSSRLKTVSRLLPGEMPPEPALFKDLSPKGLGPSPQEITFNPRARSARLRVIERSVINEAQK